MSTGGLLMYQYAQALQGDMYVSRYLALVLAFDGIQGSAG